MESLIVKNELRVEYTRGTGPGGQRKNKVNSACRITHIPTGVTAYCDERNQTTSYRKAMKDLEQKLSDIKQKVKDDKKKARRDEAIQPQAAIRTYDFKRGIVKDHRTGKEASIKEVMGKGRIDLLR